METISNVIDKNWKALIKPNKLDITSNEDKTIAKVVAEPLEKGFGQTIGNSLRRILLSSIQGAAVTAIQIDGVLHEFSSIKGVREDVTDIVLNVKNLAIKSSSSSSKNPKITIVVLDAHQFRTAITLGPSSDSPTCFASSRESKQYPVVVHSGNTVNAAPLATVSESFPSIFSKLRLTAANSISI